PVRRLAALDEEALQVLRQLRRRLVAMLAILGERFVDDALELRRDVAVDDGGRLYLDVAHHLEEREFAVGGEAALTGAELVEDDADGEDVGAPVEAEAADLLRAHVRELALERAGARAAGFFGRLGDTEVDDLDL